MECLEKTEDSVGSCVEGIDLKIWQTDLGPTRNTSFQTAIKYGALLENERDDDDGLSRN